MVSPSAPSIDKETMLRDVSGESVIARWVTSRADLKAYLQRGAIKGHVALSLPHGNALGGMLYLPEDSRGNQIQMVMSEPDVRPELADEGIDKRLISALGHIAKQNQAEVIVGQPESADTVTAIAEVFGEANLRYAMHPGEEWGTDLQITMREAAVLFRADPEDRLPELGIIVDLRPVPTNSLEAPVIR